MGSKKHKKESKKRKHRSRSRSPVDGEERERKRHKKHKDRKKNRSPDVEEVPLDSHLQKPPVETSTRSVSKEPDHTRDVVPDREAEKKRRSKDRSEPPASTAVAAAGGGGQESLSIEETNKLRAKLGLKPLQLQEKPAEDGKIKDDLGEFYHKPAANIAELAKSEKIRQKIEERREKRKLEQKLKTKTLGEESEDDDDPMAWIQRSRQIEKQKQEAAKRAAMLDEMDAVFGVGSLVAEEEQQARAESYTHNHLKGLRVAHDIAALGEERETILTLADKPVLADDAEDVLVNVNIVDDEKYKKNISERKKARAGYQAYDEEAELAHAQGAPRAVLAKYDDEIAPEGRAKQGGFFIGDEDAVHASKFREMMRAERLAGGVAKRLESLQLPALRRATDYMDEHEMNAVFKKTKKRGKIRKKAKHEPIDVEDYDPSTAPLETDDTDVKVEQLSAVQDEEETEPDAELQAALARARRRLQGAPPPPAVKVEEILSSLAKEEPAEEEEQEPAMVLDATAEFCRTLGDIPTYGLAGNRDHAAEIMELEPSEAEAEAAAEAAEAAGGAAGAWSRVDVASEPAPDLRAEQLVGLVAEPRLGAGVAGALQLALSKGYLERAGAAPAPRAQHLHLLAARHYSIEDKAHAGEDEKHGRRERAYAGPLVEFREKAFRPNIKLEYVDDDGRPLCPKEAFRYLSHKFHGKGPGKNKQEKRIKKAVQEGLMKKMSSTDTPLNTLQMLQDKQRETHSPYIVLSGAKRDNNN